MTDKQGSIAVEVAVTIAPFLLIILASVELLRFCFNKSALDYAANRTARWASIGGRSYAALDAHLRSEIGSLGLSPQGVSLSICPQGNPSCGGQLIGSGRQYVILKVVKPFVGVFGFPNAELDARVLVKNEPF